MPKPFKPKSEIGQHILLDREVIRQTCELVPSDAPCVEIGPGPGTLTRELLAQGNPVVAFEIDTDCQPMLDQLAEEEDGALAVHWGNFLDVPSDQLNHIADEWHLVGNIPYNISEPLMNKMTDLQFESAVLLVGNRLATNITRQSPERGWSRMSLIAQGYFNVEKIREVPREAFDPEPRTTSALIRIERKDKVDPNWEKDAVARSYRALVEANVNHSTAAKALKTISVDHNGLAQGIASLNKDKGPGSHRTQRQMTRRVLQEYKDRFNNGTTGEVEVSRSTPTPPETMLKLVSGRVDERILSRPLTNISNDDLRKLCSAICTVVNERQKR